MTKTIDNCYHFNTTEISRFLPDLLAIKVPFEAVLYEDNMHWFLEIIPKDRIHLDEFNNACEENNIERKITISSSEAERLISTFSHTKKSECIVPHIEVLSSEE